MIENISYESSVFSLAVSRDEKRIACGGTQDVPITVWNLAEGNIIGRFSGLKHQAHALVFSPDGSRIAAANLWGGMCVWNTATGEQLHQKPETRGRRYRYLVFPETKNKSEVPVMSSWSMYQGIGKILAPNGKWQASINGKVVIHTYRTNHERAVIDPQQQTVSSSGCNLMAWSADSSVLAMAGPDWAGVWHMDDQKFHARKLPTGHRATVLAVLRDPVQVIYANENCLATLLLPDTPVLSKWEKSMAKVEIPNNPDFKTRRDWNWDVTSYGYEGVHTMEEGHLVWYNHSHNPHHGGYGHEQTFDDFLAHGPASPIPEDILVEVYQVVKVIAGR
jgi:WD40 repeat protein